eukprot:Blabericola_migrator_1__8135@NODE_419_length_8686_cov_23_589744_g331_i0_p4_GENE_NODE_419_length_8686_cov_23_589744_g331_i0NODE_419_length_8686_cov_23_589744_g331_i0_p4_ORF_typecomplete_len116_score8_80_NODE_419_length_8686_cov_23_589744_g331_i074667813
MLSEFSRNCVQKRNMNGVTEGVRDLIEFCGHEAFATFVEVKICFRGHLFQQARRISDRGAVSSGLNSLWVFPDLFEEVRYQPLPHLGLLYLLPLAFLRISFPGLFGSLQVLAQLT